MPHPTGPSDPNLLALIRQLRRKKEYVLIAKRLSRPRRQKTAVNIAKLDKAARKSDALAVAGKVLSAGKITKPVNVYAWQFSAKAKEKIIKAGGNALPLSQLAESGEKARVVG